MKLTVLDATDSAAWNDALQDARWSHSDVYFRGDWYRHWQRQGLGDGRALLIEVQDVRFFYPFLIRAIEGYDIPQGVCDVETAYGFGGVIATEAGSGVDDDLVVEFNSVVDSWMAEQRVVCEFLRLAPELNRRRYRGLDYDRVRSDLYLEVGGRSTDEIWTSLAGPTRTAVRKAGRNGLEIMVDGGLERIGEFAEIYRQAAARIGMAAFYHFDHSYFETVADELQDQGLLLLVCRGTEVVAGSLWLLGGDVLHYYLGATRDDALDLRCADLYMWGAIEWAVRHPEISQLHFGGGLALARDSLFKFKSKYADHQQDVFVATGIHDPAVRDQLVTQWRARYPHLVEEHGHKLLCYRVVE